LAYFERLCENPQTLQNPQRMMRFVEVCIGTGALFFLNQNKTNAVSPIIIGLEAERSNVYPHQPARRYYDATWPINRSQGLVCQ
jgi:tRNA dimethylallyltransferase